MARINRPHETPPDGWFFIVPETGVRIEGDFLSELVERVRAHRQWRHGKPFSSEETKLEVERQICSGMPEGICAAEPGEDYRPFEDRSRAFSTDMVMGASRTALEFVANGGELVSKEESARRAAICRGCRFNRQSPSWICSTLCSTLETLIPKARIEPGLELCGVCACSLKAKSLLPLHVIHPANDAQNLRFPSYCWQLKSNGEENTVPASEGTIPA